MTPIKFFICLFLLITPVFAQLEQQILKEYQGSYLGKISEDAFLVVGDMHECDSRRTRPAKFRADFNIRISIREMSGQYRIRASEDVLGKSCHSKVGKLTKAKKKFWLGGKDAYQLTYKFSSQCSKVKGKFIKFTFFKSFLSEEMHLQYEVAARNWRAPGFISCSYRLTRRGRFSLRH